MSTLIKKPSAPAAIDQWANEDSSVFDFPGEGMLRSLVKMVTPDISDVMSPMPTGPAAPLISIFKNAAARKLATSGFVQKMQGLPNQFLGQAAEEFAARYPRVAAHINPSVGKADGPVMAQVEFNPNRGKNPINMEFTPPGMADVKSYEDAQNLLYHEGAHAAQALGNSDLNVLYRMGTQTKGYLDNPFEQNARMIAERKMRNPDIPAPVPAHQRMEAIAKEKPVVSNWGNMMPGQNPGFDPRKMIQMVLDHRTQTAARGMTPPKPDFDLDLEAAITGMGSPVRRVTSPELNTGHTIEKVLDALASQFPKPNRR